MNENAKIRVLIAEDDPIQNDLLKDALELESDMACCGQACDGLKRWPSSKRNSRTFCSWIS